MQSIKLYLKFVCACVYMYIYAVCDTMVFVSYVKFILIRIINFVGLLFYFDIGRQQRASLSKENNSRNGKRYSKYPDGAC